MRSSALILSLLLSVSPLLAAPVKTHTEASNYRTTPSYAETLAFIAEAEKLAPDLIRMEPFGKSGDGRDLMTVVLSKGGASTPEAAKAQGKAVLLVINGIHAGEIDGKDASLALIRDIAAGKRRELLDKVTVVLIPVYNVDGHERVSVYNRINQAGPDSQGWRTTSINLNLNRDFMKADAVETRAYLKLWSRWDPDMMIDNHVTDGTRHRIDTSFAIDYGPNVMPETAQWSKKIEGELTDRINRFGTGNIAGPYIELKDETDPKQGFGMWEDPPRFSVGHALVHNRPGILVEMHSYADYGLRVKGNYAFMVSLLELLNRDAGTLTALNQAADTFQEKGGRDEVLRTEPTGLSEPYAYPGYRYKQVLSPISGAVSIAFEKTPETFTVPFYRDIRAALTVTPPTAYIIPAAWTQVIGVLDAHGVRMQRTVKAWTGTVETWRCTARWAAKPFEGRMVLGGGSENGAPAADCRSATETITYPANSVVVPTGQKLGRVATQFLEPKGPDSALYWGFFNAIFEDKEYGSPFILEDLANRMMAENPALKAEFYKKVSEDPAFAADPNARWTWFFDRSPWADKAKGLYPVGRLKSVEGVPVGE